MKKKIISLVLVLCVLCMSAFFAGCKEDATAVINDALKNTQALDTMDAELKMEMNMSMDGMTMSIPIVADIKAKDLKGSTPTMSSVITMTLMGQETKMELYQEGKWAYIVAEGMKYKTNVYENISEYDYSDDVKDMLQTLPEELLAGVKPEKNSDGSSMVTVTIPDDKFEAIYSDFLKGINQETGVEGVEAKISNANVKITVLNGYVSVYDMQFEMNVTVEGIATKTDVKASITYKNPGENVTITPPEGYQSFEELNLSDLEDLEDFEDIEF